jgi:ribose 1,5-bisphosphokinase
MAEGTLFYIIGPSGSGKDSLLNFARKQINGEIPILFTHRYITRPADAGGENHIALTPAEFSQREALGMFAMSWQSHDNSYGIGIEIEYWLRAGARVVVNGSREYLPTASERLPAMQVILIDVSPDVLRQRLTDRGRETPEEIDARIERNNQIPPIHHPNLTVLNNDKGLEESGLRFVELLTM